MGGSHLLYAYRSQRHLQLAVKQRTWQSVYLMVKTTKREAKEAVRIAKQVSGVKQIIKVFEYLNSRPITEIKAQERRELEAKKQIEIDAPRKMAETSTVQPMQALP